jgi:hypothetical protein
VADAGGEFTPFVEAEFIGYLQAHRGDGDLWIWQSDGCVHGIEWI